MGLNENDESHPVLGNIKQALETLVQQRLELYNGVEYLLIMLLLQQLLALDSDLVLILSFVLFGRYLQKDKVNGPEGNTWTYELAERALDGPVNEGIKEYISQVLFGDKLHGSVFFFHVLWLHYIFFCLLFKYLNP